MRVRYRLLLVGSAASLALVAALRGGPRPRAEEPAPRDAPPTPIRSRPAAARLPAAPLEAAPLPAAPLPAAGARRPPALSDAGTVEPPPALSAVQARAIERWFDDAAAACASAEPTPPARFSGTAAELTEHVCPLLTRRDGPRVVDPDASWIERPSRRAPGATVASVGSGDRGDWSWELYFDLRPDGEIVAVWAGGFAACPYVVVRAGEGWIERGEILRHLRGPEREARESLTVPVGERTLRIRIEERKNEVTYLDDVYLELGGQRVRPVRCPRAAHCRDDQRYTRIEPGEALALAFRVPPSWLGRDASLVAEGHYRVRIEPPPPRPGRARRPR